MPTADRLALMTVEERAAYNAKRVARRREKLADPVWAAAQKLKPRKPLTEAQKEHVRLYFQAHHKKPHVKARLNRKCRIWRSKNREHIRAYYRNWKAKRSALTAPDHGDVASQGGDK